MPLIYQGLVSIFMFKNLLWESLQESKEISLNYAQVIFKHSIQQPEKQRI